MIQANDIGRTSMTALWCQSPTNDSHTSTWLAPNGTTLATTPTAPLYILHDIGRVGLFVDHENQDFTSFEGVFRCIKATIHGATFFASSQATFVASFERQVA